MKLEGSEKVSVDTKTMWTTMAIRKSTYDRLKLMADYEHRTGGEMVAVMMRDYYDKVAKNLHMTIGELMEFLYQHLFSHSLLTSFALLFSF